MNQRLTDQIKIAFLDLIADEATLGQMCTCASEFLGLPVAITITTRTIIARSENYTQELVEEYADHFRFSNPEEIRERVRYIDEKLAQRHAFAGVFPMMRYPHVNCGCFWESNMLGVLDVPVTQPKDDLKDTMEMVEFMAPYFLLALRLNKYVTGQMTFSMQVYLSGLLNGDPSEWVHTHRLYDSELNRIRQWQIVYLPPLGDALPPELWDRIVRFCARYESAWPVEYRGGIVILGKAYDDMDLDRLEQLFPELPRIAVSEPFSDLKTILNHLHACQRTIDLAAFDEAEERVVLVENYKMPISYLVLKRSPNGMSLYHPAIDLIRRHDQEHETEYLRTLRVYLLNEMNYQKTAKKLIIHKNTVMYRIQRIEELFHLNLRDCRVITALYLSFFESYQRKTR